MRLPSLSLLSIGTQRALGIEDGFRGGGRYPGVDVRPPRGGQAAGVILTSFAAFMLPRFPSMVRDRDFTYLFRVQNGDVVLLYLHACRLSYELRVYCCWWCWW